MSEVVTPRRKSLLEHFSTIKDTRQPCKVMYPLSEVLLLVVCGTMAACDDYDDIVLWGSKHLDFLRRLQPYHFGIPCADWLRVVMNRIGPDLFASCFLAFVAERLPEAVGQIAIDGKTSRRSHDRGCGQAALHLVSAYATTHSLVLGQRAGASRTASTGFSMSSSRRTNRACAATTALQTWQWSATSPSTSSAPCPANNPSRESENSQPGIPTTSWQPFKPVNLDSLPWSVINRLD